MLTNLHSKVQTDRLISVFVGENTRPYFVQESVLAGISDFFRKALKHESNLGTERGVLRQLEDDHTAWEMLLYWRIKGKILCYGEDFHSKVFTLVHCAVLGDKYDTKSFRDEIT